MAEKHLNGANGLTMSGGGSRVYIGSATDNAVVVFARDPASGALGFIGKVANGADRVLETADAAPANIRLDEGQPPARRIA